MALDTLLLKAVELALGELAKQIPITLMLGAVIWIAIQRANKIANGTTSAVQRTTQNLGTEVKNLASSVIDLRATIGLLHNSLIDLKVSYARLDERVTSVERIQESHLK